MMQGLSGGVCLTAAPCESGNQQCSSSCFAFWIHGAGKELLMGVDIGGLGTPIASLASLIAYQYYAKSKLANPAKYLQFFFIYQFIGLFLLLAIKFIML